MDSQLSIAGEIAGAPMNASLTRSADGGIRQGPITLPAAESGTLSTRTNDTSGELTIADTTLETGDIIDLYWDGGMRYDVVVGVVAGNVVPISGGSGDVLPAQDTAITADEQVTLDVDFDGANLVAIGAKSSKHGHIGFQESGSTEVEVELTANEPWTWLNAQNITNPLVATVVDAVKISNADANNSATFDLGVLYDSTP